MYDFFVKILLLSMPDSFEHMPPVVVRMPNGALSSLAGNVDPHHEIQIADLILVQRRGGETAGGVGCERENGGVGFFFMMGQRGSARKSICLCSKLLPPG